jgi:hypothetical protein
MLWRHLVLVFWKQSLEIVLGICIKTKGNGLPPIWIIWESGLTVVSSTHFQRIQIVGQVPAMSLGGPHFFVHARARAPLPSFASSFDIHEHRLQPRLQPLLRQQYPEHDFYCDYGLSRRGLKNHPYLGGSGF